MNSVARVSVSEVADIFNGKTPAKRDQRDSGYPVLKIKDVSESGGFRGQFESFVDESFANSFSAKKLLLNDTMVLNAAHNADYVGSKQYRVQESVVGALPTGEWLILRAKQERLDPVYASHWMSSNATRFQIKRIVKGIHLYPKDVEQLEIPLPALQEQKRIGAILDKADMIRRKRRKAIQLADQFLRSVFLDLFGDPVTNPKAWPLQAIGSVCTIVRGSSPRPKGDSRYYGGPVPRLMVQDLTRDGKFVTPKIDSLTLEGAKLSRPIDAGTVVMAVSGNVGLSAILEVDACVHDGFIAMKNMDEAVIMPEFMVDLMMFLKSTHAAREAGAIFKNLTTTQIKEMEIPIPPISRQDEYLQVADQLRHVTKSQESATTEAEGLFLSLSQRAFAGELIGLRERK